MNREEVISTVISKLWELNNSCPYLKGDRESVPSRPDAEEFIDNIQILFFNLLLHRSVNEKDIIEKAMDFLINATGSPTIAFEFIMSLPQIESLLITDISAMYEGDPAAGSAEEIIISYPGIFAIMVYRLSHKLYTMGVSYLPRLMSEIAHERTGIDIHPGARIGESFCIDHGTGVVIGETAVIGDRVKIYQGVTIGAKSFERDENGAILKGRKRHPDIGDDCVIYANATILGGDTKIGKGCVVGGNVWLTHSLSDGTKIYYNEK